MWCDDTGCCIVGGADVDVKALSRHRRMPSTSTQVICTRSHQRCSVQYTLRSTGIDCSKTGFKERKLQRAADHRPRHHVEMVDFTYKQCW